MAHVFEIRPKARHTVRFFIDPETYLDSGREDRVFESDGTLVITRRLNYDHFHANDMVVPGRVESYVNGKLLQTMVIEQAQINSGVLDSVFQRPVADPTQ